MRSVIRHMLLSLLLISVAQVTYAQVTLTVTSITDPSCDNSTSGQVVVEVTGGVNPYTVIVNGITNPLYNESVSGGAGQTVFTLPDAAWPAMLEGSYAITAVDQVLDIDATTVTLTIAQPVLTVPGAPVDICDNDTPVDLTTLVMVDQPGGTFTFGGNGVSGSTFDPSGLSGIENITVQYDLGVCTVNDDFDFNVNLSPVPTITGPINICEGTTANVYNTEAGQTNYAWTISAGGTITNGGGAADDFVEVTWTTAGPQTVSVNYENAAGCTATTPTVLNVTVNPLPVSTITGPTTVCEGSTLNVYTTETGQTNYTWVVSAGGTITNGGGVADDFVEVTWNTAGPETVSINYTDANGCTAVAPTVENVTVSALPTPTITGAIAACDGSTETYTTEAGQSNYVWTVPTGGTITSGGTATDDFVEVNWTTIGPHTVTVNYENAAGCTATTPTVLNVTVNAIPAPTIAGPNKVCEGTTLNNYTTEAGQTNYMWVVSAGGTITNGGGAADDFVEVTWTTAGAQTVSVNYENASGCTAVAPTVFNVTVDPLPAPALTGDNDVCEGEVIIYSTDPGQTNYTWVVSAGGTVTNGGTVTDDFVEVTWNTAGPETVSVNYTDANGCTAVAPTVSNITVNGLPAPTITGPLSVCEGTTHTYTTEGGQTNYTWAVPTGGTITNGGGTTDDFVEVQWTMTGGHTVQVNYTNPNGCTALVPTIENITVNASPTPTIAGPAIACEGDAGNVYTSEPGQSNYVWIVSSGGTITAGGGAADNTVTVTWTLPGARTVSVNYENGNGCTAPAPFVFNVAVDQTPSFTTQPVDMTGCDGFDVTFTSVAAGDNLSYQWFESTGGPFNLMPGEVNPDLTLTAVDPSMDGNQYHVVVSGLNCPSVTSNDVLLTVDDPPVITADPIDMAACEGADVTFSVTATGSSLTYQWQESIDGGTIFNDILGETASTLTLSSVTGTMNLNQYQVIVDGPNCPSVTSAAATLTLSSGILTQPGDQSVCDGGNATFVVSAVGPGDTYQWQEDDGAGFVDMAGETGTTLSLTAVSVTSDGFQYRAVVSWPGCPDIISDVATLNVDTDPAITSDPSDVDACENDDVTFSVMTTGAGIDFQWQESTDGGTNFTDISGETNADLVLTSVPLALDGNQYRVIVSNACNSITSAVAALTVTIPSPPPTVDPVPGLCQGDAIPTLTANGTNVMWHSDAAKSDTLGIGNVYVPTPDQLDTSTPGTTFFFASQFVGCERSDATGVGVTVIEIVYSVNRISESFPDLPTGSISIGNVTGGSPGYEIRAELVQPTSSFPGQTFLLDWTPMIEDTVSNTFSYDLTNLYGGFYEIMIRDASGCIQDVLDANGDDLEVPLDDNLFVPNVFTPNKDGHNDVFFIRNLPEDSPSSLVIINRYGKVVFETSNYDNAWAAEDIADGVYYYTLNIQGQEIKGWVEVWRGTR